MFSSLLQVKPEYMVSGIQCFYEFPVANDTRIIWVKLWMHWLSVRSRVVCVLVVTSPQQFYLGGNYGSGKRGGGVSTLICAVLDDRNATQTDEDLK
jgi:DNA ligase 4